MPFELIMLLGFFGAGLLGLLPEAAKEREESGFRRRSARRRSETSRRADVTRHTGRAQGITGERTVRPLRGGSRAVA